MCFKCGGSSGGGGNPAPEPKPINPVNLRYQGTLSAPSPFTGKTTNARINFGKFLPVNQVDVLDAPEFLLRGSEGNRLFSLEPANEEIPSENVQAVIDALGSKVSQVDIHKDIGVG